MKRRVGYKRRFHEMSYKTHEEAAMVVDTIIEKMSNCQSIKELHRVIQFFPIKNKEFMDKVLVKSGERSKEPVIVIIPDAFVRNLKFKAFCIITLAIPIGSIKRRDIVNIDYYRGLAADQIDAFNLPDEIQGTKAVYKFMDTVSNMQNDEMYRKNKVIPEKYENLILLEIKTLVVLLTKYTQKVTGKQESSEKIERMIEEVEKIREQIPVKELGWEKKDKKLEYEIYVPGEDGEGCVYEGVDLKELKDKFESLKDKHKLLIDDRYQSIYVNGEKIEKVRISRKSKKTGRIKYEEVELGFAKYNLLVWFLKHKDERFNARRLHSIGWSHAMKDSFPQNYSDRVKNEISILNAVFETWGVRKKLRIKSERLLGYRCEGNYDFCLVLKSKYFPSGHIYLEQVPENHTSLKEDL